MAIVFGALIGMFDWTVGALVLALIFGAVVAMRDSNGSRNGNSERRN